MKAETLFSYQYRLLTQYCVLLFVFLILSLFYVCGQTRSFDGLLLNNSQAATRSDAKGSRVLLLRHGTEWRRADRQQQRRGLSLLQNAAGHRHALLHGYGLDQLG